MEKDIDEVGKVSRYLKSKIEGLDKEVRPLLLLLLCSEWVARVTSPHASSFFCGPEFNEQAEAWMWKRNSCRPNENGNNCVSYTHT
jgi:hypothetical protein